MKRDTEDNYLNTKSQRNKGFLLDTKVTSDLKVATKPCGCLIIKHRGTKNFVDFV